MVEKEIILTESGFKKLKDELQYLKSVRRKEVAKRIKEAREYGDINENSEYDDAKNEQAFLEGRIKSLEQMVRFAKIIAKGDKEDHIVGVGDEVVLLDLELDERFTYTIVGSAEADPSKNRISNESPIGQAIINKEVGDVVKVEVPAGVLTFQILEIVD